MGVLGSEEKEKYIISLLLLKMHFISVSRGLHLDYACKCYLSGTFFILARTQTSLIL